MRSTASPIGINAICGKHSGVSLLVIGGARPISRLSVLVANCPPTCLQKENETLNRLHNIACLKTDTDLVTVDAEKHPILGIFFRPKNTIG